MPAAFDLLVAADVLYDHRGSWRETIDAIAQHLDVAAAGSRALCVFGNQKRSEQARAAVDAFERAAEEGSRAGLRCIARQSVCEEGQEEGIRMLLLAPAVEVPVAVG